MMVTADLVRLVLQSLLVVAPTAGGTAPGR